MSNRKTDSSKDWSKTIELVDSSDFHKTKYDSYKYYTLRNMKAVWHYFCGTRSGLLKTLLFVATGYASFRYRFMEIWLAVAGILLIFDNLGTRKKGTLSAYSVFNKNFERPIGQMGDPYKGMAFNVEPQAQAREGDRQKTPKEELPMLYFSKFSKYGNHVCYCGTGAKYKKCCYELDQIYGPHNQERIPVKDLK
jgi:hypothetical protein